MGLTNVSIYDYMSYREFLKDYYRERHGMDRAFSHRRISEALGDKSPSFFLKVIQEGRKLKDEQIELLPHILQLDEAEGNYFKALYLFGNARNKGEREYWLQQIISKCRVARNDLGASSDLFYSCWLNSPVRAALSFKDVGDDVSPLVRIIKPRPTPTQVKESIQLLARLGMIAKNDKGFWKPTQTAVFTKSAVHESLLKSYRLQSLDQARDAVLSSDNQWPTQFFTSTFSLSDEAWALIQERLQRFRKEIRAIINEDPEPPTRVIHLQQVAFALTEEPDDAVESNH